MKGTDFFTQRSQSLVVETDCRQVNKQNCNSFGGPINYRLGEVPHHPRAKSDNVGESDM